MNLQGISKVRQPALKHFQKCYFSLITLVNKKFVALMQTRVFTLGALISNLTLVFFL